MRSGTSYFDWTVFKKTVCRFWPLWGAYLAIWLVTLPLNGLMMLRLDANSFNNFGSYMENFAMNRVPQAAGEGGSLSLAVVFGVLCAMAVFSHLYNARSANLFGALPIRREGLFVTHYLAGLASLIVPNGVIFLLTLLVELAGGYVSMQGLLFWLAAACGEGFFFYSMAVFCGLFTGHILALPAFYGVFNVIVIGITELVHVVLRSFYYGFSGFTEEVYNVVKWFTPVVKLEESVGSRTYWLQSTGTDSVLTDGERALETQGLGTVGIYAAVALALTACAFFLYRARRLESAGDVVSVNGMKPVFKYGVALCAGLTFGMGTVAMTGGGETMLMIAIVVWGVIGYFGAQMLLDKSFRVFKKWKGAVAVTAVFAALFCVVGFDLTGFETRIPDPASVDSVYVSAGSAVYLADDGDRLNQDITDPGRIELITILHREAAAQRDWSMDDYAATVTEHGSSVGTDVKLTYFLKGGGSLTRYYWVRLNPKQVNQEGTAAWAVQQLYNDRELYWQVYGFDKMEEYLAEGGRLDKVEYENYDEKTGMMTADVFYGRDARALLAAVKEDFFAGRIGVRRVGDEDNWRGRPEKSIAFSTDSRDNSGYYYIRIAVQDTASSTLAALEEMADQAVRSGDYPYTDGPGAIAMPARE